MDFLRKGMYSEGQLGSGNRGGSPIWGLDPPPLGEQECMEFPRKTIDSEVSDEVRFRSNPIRRARMYGIPQENNRF